MNSRWNVIGLPSYDHANGFASLLYSSMDPTSFAARSSFDLKPPLCSALRWRMLDQSSTWLSHETG